MYVPVFIETNGGDKKMVANICRYASLLHT